MKELNKGEMVGNKKVALLKMGNGFRARKGGIKTHQDMLYLYVPVLQNRCSYDVLQTHSTKKN